MTRRLSTAFAWMGKFRGAGRRCNIEFSVFCPIIVTGWARYIKLIRMYQFLNIIYFDNIQLTSLAKRWCWRNITPGVNILGCSTLGWCRHYINLIDHQSLLEARNGWWASRQVVLLLVTTHSLFANRLGPHGYRLRWLYLPAMPSPLTYSGGVWAPAEIYFQVR